MTFLVARNENRQLDDLLQVDFGRVPKNFFCRQGPIQKLRILFIEN